MPSYVTPKNGAAFVFYVTLTSQADGRLAQNNPTLAAGDAKVSIDGGALANLTTLPAVTPAGSRGVKVSLSAAEMTGDNIRVMFSDVAGAEWCDLSVSIQTTARQIDDLPAGSDYTPARAAKLDNLDALVSSRTKPADTQARVTLVDTVTTNTDMLTQANVRAAVGLATANLDAQLAAIAGYIDTEVATLIASIGAGLNALVVAVKAKTDNLPSDPAAASAVAAAITAATATLTAAIAALNNLSSAQAQSAAAAALTAAQPIQADVRKVNNVAITGTGTTLDPWGPA